MSASILGPAGTPMVELAGDRAWLKRTIGEFVVSFQWLDLRPWGWIEDDGPVACMCIFRGNRAMDCVPYVIPQRNAHMYAHSKSGQPTPYAMGAAFKACVAMGMHPAEDTIRKLLDIIVEGIPDLIRMPADQPHDLHVTRRVLGIEAKATVNGRVMNEEVL